MEAGLAELLLDVDLAGRFQRQQPGAHPADLLLREALLGNVDACAGQMRAGDVALGRRGVAVHLHQLLLIVDGAHRRADFKRPMKLSRMGAREVGEKAGRPGPAVAAVHRQVAIYIERRGDRNRNQHLARDAVGQIVVVLDPL